MRGYTGDSLAVRVKRHFGLLYRNKYAIYENAEKWIVFL